MSVLTEPRYVPGQGWFAWDGARWVDASTLTLTGSGPAAVIALSGVIGEGRATAEQVRNQLARAGAQPVTVTLDSPGGDLTQGLAIAEALARHPAPVTARISRADSTASWIAQACQRRIMLAGASMMIHEVAGHVERDVHLSAAGLRGAAAGLERDNARIAKLYASRAGGSVADWRQRMAAGGIRYSPATAVAAGLADEYV